MITRGATCQQFHDKRVAPKQFHDDHRVYTRQQFVTTRWSTREQFHDDKHFSKQSLAQNLIYIVIFNHLSEISNVALLMCRLQYLCFSSILSCLHLSLNVVNECCMKNLTPASCWKLNQQSVLRAPTATTTTSVALLCHLISGFTISCHFFYMKISHFHVANWKIFITHMAFNTQD